MAAKKKEEQPQTFLCYICGEEIVGDHVRIKTRRGTDIHIHNKCFQKEKENAKTHRGQ